MEDQSVCFGICSGRGIHDRTAVSLDATIEVLHAAGIRYNKIYCGGHFLESQRGKIVRDFLKSDFANLFFIDADEEFSPIAVMQLLNREEEIIAGAYHKKEYPESYSVNLIQRDGHPIGKVIGPNLALLRASLVGTGFMRIRRSALEQMERHYSDLLVREFIEEEPWIDMFGRLTIDGYKFGEDKSFCRRWTDIGGEIWVYPDFDFVHYEGAYGFKGNFHKYLLRKNQEQGGV